MKDNRVTTLAVVQVVMAVLTSYCVVCDNRDDSPESVVGFVGSSVKLSCNIKSLPPSPSDGEDDGGQEIEWVDLVYNVGREPQRIYSTVGQLGLDKTHENVRNYQVDAHYSLTINNLKLEKDAGQYICKRIVKGTTYSRSHYLNVGDMPKCLGSTALRPGDTTRLSCQAQYSGVLQPVLTWVRDGLEIDSIDDYDIMLASRSVRVAPVTDQEDGVEYTCHMKFGSAVEQCRLQLDVTFLARDIVLSPQKPDVSAGDELRCSARGNPAPEITLSAQSPAADVRHGKGWKSLSVPDQWTGNMITVTCTASNTIDGATETLTQTAMFNVTEKENMLSTGTLLSGDASIMILVAGAAIILVIIILVIIITVLIRRRKTKKKKVPTATLR